MNSFVSAFHDAVLLYALAVNETLEAGIDPTSGIEVTKRMWNRTFTGERLAHTFEPCSRLTKPAILSLWANWYQLRLGFKEFAPHVHFLYEKTMCALI